MKETFKGWKALSSSTPQEKGWSFLVKQIRKVTIEKGNEMLIKVGKPQKTLNI